MEPNPYERPEAVRALREALAVSAQHPRRFRARLIPATFCFLFGGLLSIAWLFGWITLIPVIARYGFVRGFSDRTGIWMLLASPTGPALLWAGWLWRRGKWLLAFVLTVTPFAWTGLLRSLGLQPMPSAGSSRALIDGRHRAIAPSLSQVLSGNEDQ
jgi:hypothetical protein